jgi:hemoglobin
MRSPSPRSCPRPTGVDDDKDKPKVKPAAPFDMMGGEAVVRKIAARFYDLMDETEPALAKLHPLDEHGKVSQRSRDGFTLFFIEWLGGPAVYTPIKGHPRLRMRHANVAVDIAMRDAWMRCMSKALTEANLPPDVQAFLEMRLSEVADFMRNTREE